MSNGCQRDFIRVHSGDLTPAQPTRSNRETRAVEHGLLNLTKETRMKLTSALCQLYAKERRTDALTHPQPQRRTCDTARPHDHPILAHQRRRVMTSILAACV